MSENDRPRDPNVGAPLRRADLDPDPFAQFSRWFAEAQKTEPVFPEGMTLATVDADGDAHARIVLLKGFDASGFVFFTNYSSRKGSHLDGHPRAEALFWWRMIPRQIHIEGRIERVSAAESDEYFSTRPRGSRISAWASKQSTVVESREVLESRMREFDEKYGEDVPRPAHWGGYRIVPERFEFWQGREDRLHDRFEYLRGEDGSFTIRRLSP